MSWLEQLALEDRAKLSSDNEQVETETSTEGLTAPFWELTWDIIKDDK